MSDYRMDKFEKRRKNTRTLNILLFVGAGLVLLLILLFLFTKSDSDDQQNANKDNEPNIENENANGNLSNGDLDTNGDINHNNNSEEENNNNSPNNESENNEEENEKEEGKIENIPSNDGNVISAFTKNWNPIGTEQEEPHTMVFEKDSQDWLEMEEAMKLATELDELIIWWLGNDGDQKAVGTVTSNDQSETYRVYLSWIENEGWQPTKVEVLLVNDKDPANQSEGD